MAIANAKHVTVKVASSSSLLRASGSTPWSDAMTPSGGVTERRDNSAGFDGSPHSFRAGRAPSTEAVGPSSRSSDQRFALSRPPVIRLLPIIQMPDASDKRGVAVTFRPIDRFSLRFEGAEHMVRMVFDDIIVDTAPLRAALWARFNVNIRHTVLSLGSFC